jgi:hypothetical protein
MLDGMPVETQWSMKSGVVGNAKDIGQLKFVDAV